MKFTGAKACVRRVPIPWVLRSNTDQTHYWRASRPGQFYLVGDGFHFDTWGQAMAYATSTTEETL